MTLTLGASIESLRNDRRHRFAKLWEIERTDGVFFRFTDHDTQITYDGNTFTPVGGFSATAVQKQSSLRVQNLEVLGVLESSSITHDDLRAGRFREAKITERVVDWLYPWAGVFTTNLFWITETTFSGEHWEAQLEGLTRWFTPRFGDVYSRVCKNELGDDDCGVGLPSLKFSKTVTQVDTQRKIFRCSGLTDADDFYDYGKIVWTSGSNSGLTDEIKNWTLVNNVIELQLNTAADIAVSDGFDIFPGCDKLVATCKTKFVNFRNFGGFPFVPGTNKMVRTPKTP